MRKLVITQNITVDGAVEMLGDWFDPQLADDDLLAESHRQDSEADALLVAKYVVSSTMTDPQGENSTVLTGDPVEQTRTLRAQPGKDIVLTGSITVAHAVIAAGLVDEYRLFVYPTVQGGGRRLFPDGTAFPTLKLVEPPKTFSSGITLLRYRAA